MESNSLQQLAYISSATSEPTSADLQAILDVATDKNQQHKITGFLMYAERIFYQIIEGPKTEIDTLYSNLLRDTRHSKVTRILYNPISSRRFADWSMAFMRFDKINDIPVKGYSNYFHEYLKSGKKTLNILDTDDAKSVEQMIDDMRKSLLGV
ncbi:BLUF domain-containing protein [Aliiglaciecola litoralis]|uniref:BLUF domain-containing protein n=1 Tax=Aliiglaciecola litoralis TaxID=582857 RepID=A0ABP3WP08_9ALTE